MRIRLTFAALIFPAALAAQQPLSAIDWLKQDIAVPVVAARPKPTLIEPPISQSVIVPQVAVTTLDQPTFDAVGLLPSSVTGLPASLWRPSHQADLVALIAAQEVDDYPAMQALLYTLLLAEAEPASDAGPDAPLLQARIDKLRDLGAIDQAQALLERAGVSTPPLFARWFDLTLLTGDEDKACDALNRQPKLSPSYSARIFCLARGGDWSTAALTLETAAALRFITLEQERLLAQFLDPDLFEDEPVPTPSVPDPLTVRMMEAIGEPLATAPLPRAFAMSDLRNTSGWKAELEAGERLAKTGALSENQLLGIYTTRSPAASGGIWDRVAAVQNLDKAITAGDATAISAALPAAWAAMQSVQLEVPFAQFYGERLAPLSLSGPAAQQAYHMALLSNGYEAAARGNAAQTSKIDRFLAGLALGTPDAALAETDQERAIAAAFTIQQPEPETAAMLAQGQLGEVILLAMTAYTSGAAGNLVDITTSLATLRSVGLEDTARRAAIQLILLKRGV